MEQINQIFKELWGIWSEMFSEFINILPKFISLSLWILSGIIIVPCIFIANILYPHWQEWGENL